MCPRQVADSFEYEQMSRRKVIVATGSAGMAGLAGCAGGGDGGTTTTTAVGDGNGDGGDGGTTTMSDGNNQQGNFDIRYIPHGGPSQDPFWAAQSKGWNKAVDQLGIKASYQAPKESSNFTQQVANIETAIDGGADGIAVTLPDPPLFQDALKRAAKEGVYVIVTNVTETGEKTMPWHGYVGQNEAIVGNVLTKNALPLFKEKAGSLPSAAVILNHDPGHSALKLRQKGIEKILSDRGISHDWIEVPSGDPSGVISRLASHRSSNPDANLVFTLGPTAGNPAIDYIKNEGLKGKVYHAGVDISRDQAKAIKNGFNLIQVIQQPALQGYLAAHYLASHLRWGILTPSQTPTGPTVVTAANIGSVQKQLDTFKVA